MTAKVLHDATCPVWTAAHAETMVRRSMAIYEQSLGAEHPTVAVSINNLAAILKDSSRLGEAEPLMRRALALEEEPALQ